MKIKVARYIADFLCRQGVTHVFTVTGGGAMHLNDAFGHEPRLQCVYNHHEQASAIAAEAYARLSGKVAVTCVTSGPGGTNAITGVLGGWLDSVPMFVVSGQVKRETTTWSTDVPLRQLGDQEYNIVASVKPMTKYAHMITDPSEIRYHLEKAWYLATTGRGGPVWLDVPLDVQAAIVETDDLRGFSPKELSKPEQPTYDIALTEPILQKIKAAKRPVILAGEGIRFGNAYEEFLALIERLQIPVVTAWNAHDLLWDEHPLFCGRPGTVGTRGGNFIVENADLLLVLGCRLNIRQISYNYKTYAKNAYKIIVDIDETELRKPTVSPDMAVHADVKDMMAHALTAPYEPNPAHAAWLSWCRDINARYPATLPSYYETKSPLNPYVFITELFRRLPAGERVICGNGSACVVTFQAAEIKQNQRLFTNSGCAAMGYGFPAAIGGCFAANGERVLCIDGDGSFQMNIQELQTAVYHRLNLKIVYLNNNGYHSIRQSQTNLFEPPLCGVCEDNGISFPDMEKLTAAYGLPYFRVESVADIDTKIPAFLETDGPVLCEVVLDPKQFFAPKLSSKVQPDGTIVSPPIDDMFPFLDKAEYARNKDVSRIG